MTDQQKWITEYFKEYVRESSELEKKRNPVYAAERAAIEAQYAKDDEFGEELHEYPYMGGCRFSIEKMTRDKVFMMSAEEIFSLSVGG